MPSSEGILNGLTAIANDWQELALVWRGWLATLIVALLAGWHPSTRIGGALFIAPVLSVSVLAWASGSPFNATAFAILAVALTIIANRLTNERVRTASWIPFLSGTLLVVPAGAHPARWCASELYSCHEPVAEIVPTASQISF